MRAALTAVLDYNKLSPSACTAVVEQAEKEAPSGFYVKYEETTLSGKMNLNKADWDAEYYSAQSAYCTMNFSKERVHHLLAVRNYLMENKVGGFIYAGN